MGPLGAFVAGHLKKQRVYFSHSRWWHLPCSFFSVSQNFCNSVKYLSSINTLERPRVAMFWKYWKNSFFSFFLLNFMNTVNFFLNALSTQLINNNFYRKSTIWTSLFCDFFRQFSLISDFLPSRNFLLVFNNTITCLHTFLKWFISVLPCTLLRNFQF